MAVQEFGRRFPDGFPKLVAIQALQHGSKHNYLSLVYLQEIKLHSGLQLVNSICGALLQDMGMDDDGCLNIVKDISAKKNKILFSSSECQARHWKDGHKNEYCAHEPAKSQ